MASEIVNATANALVWITSAFDAPTRAVVFGVPIDGNPLLSFYPLFHGKVICCQEVTRNNLKQPLGTTLFSFLEEINKLNLKDEKHTGLILSSLLI